MDQDAWEEKQRAPKGYRKPKGYTWKKIAEERARLRIGFDRFPYPFVLGGVRWVKPEDA